MARIRESGRVRRLILAFGILNKETIVCLFRSLIALWFEADRPLGALKRAVLAAGRR